MQQSQPPQFQPGNFPMPGQPQQLQPGQPQPFSPGQPQPFPPGQPFLPGQPQQFPAGQPQPFPPGQPQQFPPGQPQQLPPSQPQFPPGQPQQLSPEQAHMFPPGQQQIPPGQTQPFLAMQPGEYQPHQSLTGQPMPVPYGAPTDAGQVQLVTRSTLVTQKESKGIQIGPKHRCECQKSIKCVNICTCCAHKCSRRVEESEEEIEPPRYGEAICAHTFCVLERAKCKPIGLPWASGLFNHQQRALPECCEPCYEPPRPRRKKKKCIPVPICQTRGPTYTTDQMIAFLKLLLLAIEITDEKEDKKQRDENGKKVNGKSHSRESSKSTSSD